jgi:acyl-[acyl-carrier-protein] desaturase
MINPEHKLVSEIEEQRPRFPAGLLSKQEKDTLIERGIVGLYRWYLARSQATRNWNPDKGFNWRALRTDHSASLNQIVEGFFAVEQFVPDYTTQTINLARTSHGRAHFQIRWGAEEEKHSDLWLNAMVFLRHRSLDWIEEYKQALRAKRYTTPWDDAFHMGFYALVQERATQLNYLNTTLVARGESDKPEMAGDADPVLAEVAQTIAVDEAAHYNFFLEITRLFLYYYPARTLEALHDVIQRFAMPALDLIPNAHQFYEAVYRAGIYGSPRQYARDVLQVAFDHLGIAGRRALAEGVKRLRQVPDENGSLRDTAIFDTLDYRGLEDAIRRLYRRVGEHESEFGLADIDPTTFVPSGLAPA